VVDMQNVMCPDDISLLLQFYRRARVQSRLAAILQARSQSRTSN
jgi:hypothetical protein